MHVAATQPLGAAAFAAAAAAAARRTRPGQIALPLAVVRPVTMPARAAPAPSADVAGAARADAPPPKPPSALVAYDSDSE